MARLLCQIAVLVTVAVPLGLSAGSVSQTGTAYAEINTNVASSSAREEAIRLAAELLDSWGPNNPTVGSNGSGQLTKAIAFVLVHDLDPSNSAWNPSHPKWPEVSGLVEGEIASDLKAEMTKRRSRYRTALINELGPRLSVGEFRKLLAYFHSADGRRYIAFQLELAQVQTAAMRSTMGSATKEGSSISVTPVSPSEQVMKERVNLLKQSTLGQVTQIWLDEAKRTHGDVSGFQAWPMMALMIANSQGPKLDEMRAQYSPGLKSIEHFNASSLGQRYYTAFAGAGRAMAEQNLAENRTFEDTEEGKFGAEWKSKYAELANAP